MIEPIYQKIAVRLEAYIRDRGIVGRLPGTRQLSRELGCHHVTISKAIRLLAEKGLLENRGVRGVFVLGAEKSARPLHRVLAMVSGLHETPANRELLAKINHFLKDYHYSMIGIHFEESLFQENPRLLLNFPVDGFLFRLSTLRKIQTQLLRQENIPAVSCVLQQGMDWLDQTDCDHAAGYALLLKKLRSAGHRRIGWIEFGRIPEYQPYLEAVRGYFQAALGPDFDSDLMFIRESGKEMLDRFGMDYCRIYCKRALVHFFGLKRPPTAIIVPRADFALELGHLLTAARIRVPDQMAVMYVSHGLLPEKLPFPGVEFDEEKMLFWGVRRLLERLKNPVLEPEKYLVPPIFHEAGTEIRYEV
ncbi:MAG: GntR family transcriptional regulator [Lentisphaeria bacterium]|nr:GntR family transcriptional regulator [Lentisphaeria bacterium]